MMTMMDATIVLVLMSFLGVDALVNLVLFLVVCLLNFRLLTTTLDFRAVKILYDGCMKNRMTVPNVTAC